MPVEAHIIEPLGAYDIVDLKVGTQFLRARTPQRLRRPGPGDTVWARLDAAQTHFFDADDRAASLAHRLEALTMAHIKLDERHQDLRRPHRARRTSTSTSRDGEFFVLLGPTGAGKTTTLRLIAGLEQPDAGQILIDGEDVGDWSAAERDVALVLQQYSLYPRYTVRENLEFPLKSKIRAATPEPRSRSASPAPRRRCASSICSTARPTGFPAARCSASRSAAPSCASRASS